MRIVSGDIWSSRFDACLRVVPVNLGWKANGENVMGRGVAQQAAKRYPDLPIWYGRRCEFMARDGDTRLFRYCGLLLFPVKPLDAIAPHLSWRQSADLGLVEKSTRQLASIPMSKRVTLPLVGCGNGGLDPRDVLPVLAKYLTDDDFTLVLTPREYGRLRSLIHRVLADG